MGDITRHAYVRIGCGPRPDRCADCYGEAGGPLHSASDPSGLPVAVAHAARMVGAIVADRDAAEVRYCGLCGLRHADPMACPCRPDGLGYAAYLARTMPDLDGRATDGLAAENSPYMRPEAREYAITARAGDAAWLAGDYDQSAIADDIRYGRR